MAAYPSKDKRCAFCIKWDGDAQLQGGPGVTKGMVKFNTGAKGMCIKRNARVEAVQGAACNDFVKNPQVEKYT